MLKSDFGSCGLRSLKRNCRPKVSKDKLRFRVACGLLEARWFQSKTRFLEFKPGGFQNPEYMAKLEYERSEYAVLMNMQCV
jgi:hypothetical protein